MNYVFSFLLITTVSFAASEELPNPEQITAAREVISDCVKKYHQAEQGRLLLEKRLVLPPNRKQKKLLKKIDILVFDQHLGEFQDFLTTDRLIMTAKTSKDMYSLAATYSSNCTRFAQGVNKFVEFSLGKNVEKDFIRYFKRERERVMTPMKSTISRKKEHIIHL